MSFRISRRMPHFLLSCVSAKAIARAAVPMLAPIAAPAAIVMVAMAASTPAFAQISSREGIALQNQIMDLRQQMSQMQGSNNGAPLAPPMASSSTVPSNAPGGGDLMAQLLDRVNTLEQQQRDMQGVIDQLTNQVKEQNAALSKQMDDLSFSLQNGKGAPPHPSAMNTDDASLSGQAPSSPPAADSHPTTPDAMLKAGNAALLKHDYDGAHDDATAALQNAKGSFRIDAQFLLAQSLAGQKQYRDSAVAYYDAYKQSPKSTRAPDALLGVTASLLALGDKKAACQALGKLRTEFPNPAPMIAKSGKIFGQRADCP